MRTINGNNKVGREEQTKPIDWFDTHRGKSEPGSSRQPSRTSATANIRAVIANQGYNNFIFSSTANKLTSFHYWCKMDEDNPRGRFRI